MNEEPTTRNRIVSSGAGLALLSAALFGASTPLAKTLLASVDPWMLAALLYLGSGFGLLMIWLVRRYRSRGTGEARLAGKEWIWLGAAIVFGGVLGPVLLMFGLLWTAASTASLLLNLEGVLTALLAWFVFRENFDRRIATGMVAIAAGAVLLSWQEHASVAGPWGPLCVAGACLAWAVDNNFTRKVSLSDPIQISMLKGMAAGAINLLLALAQGQRLPELPYFFGAGVVGLLGYGISLVFFVTALRHIGTARTGAYYSTAPFVGAVIAIVVLHDSITIRLLAAGALMGVGVWLHLTERHEHEHEHEPFTHTHRHWHDAHHRHEHGADDPMSEPHTHRHSHVRLRHTHRHYPDSHHRHSHRRPRDGVNFGGDNGRAVRGKPQDGTIGGGMPGKR